MIKSLLLVILLVIVDQASKIYLTLLNNIEPINVTVINNFFKLTYATNQGAAFSMLQGKRVFFVIVTTIVLAFLVIYMYKSKVKGLERFSLLLIISGAIGNLIDRVIHGYVIDFLDFYIFGYDFPIFNFADCFITVGVILLIIVVLFEEKGDKNAGN